MIFLYLSSDCTSKRFLDITDSVNISLQYTCEQLFGLKGYSQIGLRKYGQNKMRDVFSSNDQCFAGVIGEKFHF